MVQHALTGQNAVYAYVDIDKGFWNIHGKEIVLGAGSINCKCSRLDPP